MRVFIVANNLANRLSDVEISALKRFDALFHNSNFELFFLTLTFNKNIHNIFIKYSDVYNESVVKGGCVNIYFDLLGYPLEFPENTVKLTGKYAFSKRVSATHERYYDEEGRLRMYVVFYENGVCQHSCRV